MPSDPTTWAELKTTLANWLNRDRDDLGAAEIPEAIALAERRFQRTIFSPERETEVTLAASAEAVALPADLWGIRAAWLAVAADDAGSAKRLREPEIWHRRRRPECCSLQFCSLASQDKSLGRQPLSADGLAGALPGFDRRRPRDFRDLARNLFRHGLQRCTRPRKGVLEREGECAVMLSGNEIEHARLEIRCAHDGGGSIVSLGAVRL